MPESPTTRDRCYQALLIGSTLALSWLLMQAVHELGHVLHLWITGGKVGFVVLHPLEISYTRPSFDPRPLITVWGGVLWGIAIPLAFYGLLWKFDRPLSYLARFFAGFCLVANGGYLIAGGVADVGDPQVMILLGSPQWLVTVLGIPMLAGGLYLWHGQGPSFGLGSGNGKVQRGAAVGMAIALVMVVVLELWLSPRY